jgi:hypothetical protein
MTSKPAAHARESWLAWWKQSGLEPLAVERTIWSEEHGYAGTMDLYARKGKSRVVIDWKTGNRIYAEAHLQNVAYRAAAKEHGLSSTAGFIVRLSKEGGDVEVQKVPKETTFETFLYTLNLWKWWRESEGRPIR